MGSSCLDAERQRATAAEALLALVSKPERAAAIAGDLVEASRDRAAWRFWLDLLGIMAAFLAQGLRASPWRSAGFLAAGFVLWFCIYLSLRLIAAALGLQPLDARLLDCSALSTLAIVILAGTLALSNFLAGATLSWISSARGGLSGCVPLAMIWGVAALVLPLHESLSPDGSAYCVLLYITALPLLYLVPLVYGGALVRVLRMSRCS